jgi:hypothetical protein
MEHGEAVAVQGATGRHPCASALRPPGELPEGEDLARAITEAMKAVKAENEELKGTAGDDRRIEPSETD